MSITPDFIRNEIEKQGYEISIHADDERIADELSVSQLEFVLLNCEIIEEYPDDSRGESCLTIGFLPDKTPVHIVCGRNPSGHLIYSYYCLRPNYAKMERPVHKKSIKEVSNNGKRI